MKEQIAEAKYPYIFFFDGTEGVIKRKYSDTDLLVYPTDGLIAEQKIKNSELIKGVAFRFKTDKKNLVVMNADVSSGVVGCLTTIRGEPTKMSRESMVKIILEKISKVEKVLDSQANLVMIQDYEIEEREEEK